MSFPHQRFLDHAAYLGVTKLWVHRKAENLPAKFLCLRDATRTDLDAALVSGLKVNGYWIKDGTGD